MSSTGKIVQSIAEYSPYVAELRDFFASRGISFGSSNDVEPFLERLGTDNAFRGEMSSMARAIIYRARDGLSPTDLLDVLLFAVAGEGAPRLGGPMRELLIFVEDVYRSRWNTVPQTLGEADPAGKGGSCQIDGEDLVETVPVDERWAGADASESSMFSRAHVMAADEWAAPRNTAEAVPVDETPSGWPGKVLDDSYDSESTSGRWVWGAVFAGLVALFCVGLFYAQRTAADVFQQRGAHASAVARPAIAAVEQPNPSPQPAGPVAPVDPPTDAVAARTPDGAQRLDRPEARPSVASSARPLPLAQSDRYTPATVGVSPALMRSRLIYAPRAEYPAIARITHVQGKVVVEAVVSRTGRVTHADVISGHRLLRGAALKAVRQRKYRPYVVDGKPRDVATVLTVNFKLR